MCRKRVKVPKYRDEAAIREARDSGTLSQTVQFVQEFAFCNRRQKIFWFYGIPDGKES